MGEFLIAYGSQSSTENTEVEVRNINSERDQGSKDLMSHGYRLVNCLIVKWWTFLLGFESVTRICERMPPNVQTQPWQAADAEEL